MSQADQDGLFLIRMHGLKKAESEAHSRWLTAVSFSEATYASWCYAVFSYIVGYRDATNILQPETLDKN